MKKKFIKYSLIMVFILFTVFIGAQNKNYSVKAQWAKSFYTGGKAKGKTSAIAVDSNENIYAVNFVHQSKSYDFGDDVILKSRYQNIHQNYILVKYNKKGTTLWAKSVQSKHRHLYVTMSDVAIDGKNNIYVCGSIYGLYGECDFGNGITFKTKNYYSLPMIIKYSSKGKVLWVSAPQGMSYGGGIYTDISVNKNGHIAVAGKIYSGATHRLGRGIVIKGNNNKRNNCFIAQHNPGGKILWAKAVKTKNGISEYEDVIISDRNEVYAVGNIQRTFLYNFGNRIYRRGVYHSAGSAFAVKFSKWGRTLWVNSMEKKSTSTAFKGIALDNKYNVYTSGYVHGINPAYLGDGIQVKGTVRYNYSGFIAKYNKYGKVLWAKSVYNKGMEKAQIRQRDRCQYEELSVYKNQIYVSGKISGMWKIDFGQGVNTTGSDKRWNAMIVSYDLSGNALWAVSMRRSPSFSHYNDISVFKKSVYAGGYITGTTRGNRIYSFGRNVNVKVNPSAFISQPVVVKYSFK